MSEIIIDVTYEEIMKECYGPGPTLEEILAEEVKPTPNYYTDRYFVKLINNKDLMCKENAWNKIFRYFTTNSKFRHLSIADTLEYFHDITGCKPYYIQTTMNYKEIKHGQKVMVHRGDNSPWFGEIVYTIPKSRTKVVVKDTERGPGWDPKSESYRGYYPQGKGITEGSWARGQNNDFGREFTIHIKYLTLI